MHGADLTTQIYIGIVSVDRRQQLPYVALPVRR
jgi:hypothetical protein